MENHQSDTTSNIISLMPTELLFRILKSITSPRDLYAFITTSSLMYDVFRSNQEAILSSVALNSLGSHILSDTLITLRSIGRRDIALPLRTLNMKVTAPKGEALDPYNCTHSLLHYIEGEKFQTDTEKAHRLKLPESIALFQFHHAVESLVQDYAFRHISKYGGPSLSPTELHRIRRAFYRYETFQTTNLRETEIRPCERDAKVWARLITAYAPTPWEVEEVVCVHQYLFSRIEEVVDMVDEEFIEAVLATTKEPARLGGDLDATRWSSGEVAKWCIDHPSCLYDLDNDDEDVERETFFRTKGSHSMMIEYLISSSLPFLRKLFNISDKKSRCEIIFKHHPTFARDLVRILLDASKRANPFPDEKQGWEELRLLEFEGDCPDKRNLAWLWANQNHPSPYYASPCDWDFRGWGYVFWDRTRLEYLKVINEPCPRVSRDWISPQQRNRGEEKTVEQRLAELGVLEAPDHYI
jgi:hypothetical protein